MQGLHYRLGMHQGNSAPIGLIADSHGKNGLLREAICMLRERGAHYLVHLGDICDSLAPDSLREAVALLQKHAVHAVKGNNEHTIIAENYEEDLTRVSPELMVYLRGLPASILRDDYCFTHSAPFAWPAASRRPISEYLPRILKDGRLPYRILFRGHSHRPSVMELDGVHVKKIPAKAGTILKLNTSRQYVITVGAVEERSAALFLPDDYELHFLSIGGT